MANNMRKTNNENILNQPSREEFVEDLIGHAPSWLLKSGIGIVAFVFVVLLCFAQLIAYPDKIEGRGILTSENPPVEVRINADGYISDLRVKDGEDVSRGQVLAYIHNTTDQEEIEELLEWIETYERSSWKQIKMLTIPNDLQLGMLQSEYASLVLQFNQLQMLQRDVLTHEKIASLGDESEKIRQLNATLRRESHLFASELELARKNHIRNKNLLKEGAVSQRDFENSGTVLLQKERQLESMQKSLVQNKIRIEQIEYEQLDLDSGLKLQLQEQRFKLDQIISRIKTQVEEWKRNFSLVASRNGQLLFNGEIANGKSFNSGETLFYLKPEKSNERFVRTRVDKGSFGKLQPGQKSLIKLDPYPYKEFGLIESSVQELKSLPYQDENGQIYYEIKIPLEDTLITEYGKRIPYRPNMNALVEIITKEKSLLERIFEQFLNLIKN